MHHGWIATQWVARPELAAADWPSSDLAGHVLPVPLALRVAGSRNVVGHLTRVTPDGLQIDHGAHHVPFQIVRAYAILRELLDHRA